MTTYIVPCSTSATGGYLTIKPGATYAVRIVKAEFSSLVGATPFIVSKITGGGVVTGGSVFTPEPMREDLVTPAAGASAKVNATTITGTGVTLNYSVVGSTGYDPTTGTVTSQQPGSGSWQPSFDFILKAGSSSVFAVQLSTNSFCAVSFEELRLQWSV